MPMNEPKTMKQSSRERPDPLDPHGEIGSRLRALYAEVESEPIPAQLIDLLEKLDEAEKQERR